MRAKTVMLVDDHEDIRAIYAELLQQRGYEVQVADSGEKALELISQSPPDLVLLDLHLPGMDGMEVVRRLRASDQTRWIPVVALTVDDSLEHLRQAERLGFRGFLIKPALGEELDMTLRQALRTGG